VTASLAPTSPAIQGILLFSLNSSLQTGLLAALISEKTGLKCQVASQFSPTLEGAFLYLIDCQARSAEDLQNLVADIQEHEQPYIAALLNATSESDHEQLLEWPCISGLFYTDTDQEQLLRGLEALLKGEYWVPRRLLHLFLEKNRRAPTTKKLDIKLTKRERQILKLIKDGATNFDIAAALEVSEHTVKSHLYNVYKKIGVRNRLEASNWVRDLEDL
jgi:DNA-binding NarL/FixJ family response regulator